VLTLAVSRLISAPDRGPLRRWSSRASALELLEPRLPDAVRERADIEGPWGAARVCRDAGWRFR